MKNREYKNHNRAIKEVKPGVWRCRLIPKSGCREVTPINIDYPDVAWRWLRFETNLRFPDPGGWKKGSKPDPKLFIHPNAFPEYARTHYRA